MVSYGILAVMLVALMTVATGEVYKVGDSAGWTNVGHLNYNHWAATKAFRVGDTIKFEYNKEFQNVVRVTHKNFRACNGTAPYAALSTGADSFTIRKTGHFYFICSLPGHCEAGQKVDIRVPPTAAPPKSSLPPITPLPFPPSPAPSPSVWPVPSHAPSSVPVPSHAPSSVPIPSHAPSSVPVPSHAPSSVPVPSHAPSSVPVPPPAPASVPIPPPAPATVPVPSPATPSVPEPSPSAPPSVPVQPPTQSPSPSPPSNSPAPSPHKNGSGKYLVNSWLTVMATVFGVLVFSF